MKKIVFIILLFFCVRLNAQVRHFIDTIKYDLNQNGKFYIGLDGKNNIVSALNLKMFGLQAGYLYNNRTSLYLGLYTTTKSSTSVLENSTAKADKTDSNTIFVTYGMSYINIGSEYIFYNTDKWKLSVPLALGIGSGIYNKYSRKKYYSSTYPFIIPVETGINATCKMTWWLWLSAGLGTRISLSGSHSYNGPFYTFGFQIKTDAILHKIKQLSDENKKKKR